MTNNNLVLTGYEGEQLIRKVLRDIYKQPNLQQLDWMVKWDDKNYYIIEAKVREMYTPPPFFGTGLDIRQIELRIELLKDLGLDTILMVLIGEDLYIRKLSELESLPPQDKFDTGNRIRIYNINRFEKITNFRERLK